MDSGSKERSVSFRITVIAILLAAFFLFCGISELLHPDVGKEFLAENTRVCITMIIMGLALLFGVFSPYWGGIVISIWTVPFVIIFHFHPIFIAFGFLVLLVGMQFFLRGRRFRKLASSRPETPGMKQRSAGLWRGERSEARNSWVAAVPGRPNRPDTTIQRRLR